MNLLAIVLVCLGGALGAVTRFWVTRLGALLSPSSHFPFPTLFVNLTGSAILGVLFALTTPDLTRVIDAPLLLFAGVGFCGAYTTFSSFCTETVALVPRSGWKAAAYVLATVAGSITAFAVPFASL